jgi:hypothetical protein
MIAFDLDGTLAVNEVTGIEFDGALAQRTTDAVRRKGDLRGCVRTVQRATHRVDRCQPQATFSAAHHANVGYEVFLFRRPPP